MALCAAPTAKQKPPSKCCALQVMCCKAPRSLGAMHVSDLDGTILTAKLRTSAFAPLRLTACSRIFLFKKQHAQQARSPWDRSIAAGCTHKQTNDHHYVPCTPVDMPHTRSSDAVQIDQSQQPRSPAVPASLLSERVTVDACMGSARFTMCTEWTHESNLTNTAFMI